MIKRILIALVAVAAVSASAMARDTYSRDASSLPKAAQTTLKNNFKANISVVKIEKELGRVSEYEVILNDGTEISFDRDGNWKDIEVAATKSVPSAFIPAAITQYIKTAQPNQKVIGISKERKGYEVELTNGVEMKFDKQGKFLRYDK